MTFAKFCVQSIGHFHDQLNKAKDVNWNFFFVNSNRTLVVTMSQCALFGYPKKLAIYSLSALYKHFSFWQHLLFD